MSLFHMLLGQASQQCRRIFSEDRGDKFLHMPNEYGVPRRYILTKSTGLISGIV
jgi:hypothetical protein